MRKALNFDLDTKKYEEFTGKQHSLLDAVSKAPSNDKILELDNIEI